MASKGHEKPTPADLAAMGMSEADWDREWAEAVTEGRQEAPDETVVVSAHYDQTTGRIVIDLAGGLTIMVPTAKLQALVHAKPDDLAQVEILGSHMLDWPKIDQQVYIPDLLKGITGTRTWMAAQLGSKGGAKRTPAKAAASRANGKKGGRPRKIKPAASGE